MKALREFFVVLLCIALVSLVTTLGVIVGLKEVFQGAFLGEVTKSMIKVDTNNEHSKEINEAIDKVTSYKGTTEIVDSFLEDISKSENDIVISDTTYELLLKAIEDNKEELIKLGASEQDINEAINEIKKPENREKMTKELNDGFKGTDTQISKSDIEALKTVTNVVSPGTIKKMIIIIAIIIAAIILLTFSPYKWIRPISISAIISGVNLLACYYAFDSISRIIVEEGANLTLDATKLSGFGYPLFFGGIAGLVVYIVINILAKKTKVSVTEEAKTEPEHPMPTPVFNENAGYNKFCSACGSPVGDEDKACSNCGAPLD